MTTTQRYATTNTPTTEYVSNYFRDCLPFPLDAGNTTLVSTSASDDDLPMLLLRPTIRSSAKSDWSDPSSSRLWSELVGWCSLDDVTRFTPRPLPETEMRLLVWLCVLIRCCTLRLSTGSWCARADCSALRSSKLMSLTS